MSLLATLNAIAKHPLNRQNKTAALSRFLRWQVGTRLVPGPVAFEWVDGIFAIIQRGDQGITQNVYCGLADLPEMAYLLHVLTPEDLFIDIGANVGSYALLACGVCGARGCCFEPVPSTFASLCRNLAVNQLLSRVKVFNLGLAETEGELVFTTRDHASNHVLMPNDPVEGTVRIPVRRLDSVLDGDSPSAIKIDVEGFESPVLAGGEKTLSDPALHSVLMELNGYGKRYGYDDQSILDKMFGLGFRTYSYDPFSRTMRDTGGLAAPGGNTLFARDLNRVMKRLEQAPRRRIHSVEF